MLAGRLMGRLAVSIVSEIFAKPARPLIRADAVLQPETVFCAQATQQALDFVLVAAFFFKCQPLMYRVLLRRSATRLGWSPWQQVGLLGARSSAQVGQIMLRKPRPFDL